MRGRNPLRVGASLLVASTHGHEELPRNATKGKLAGTVSGWGVRGGGRSKALVPRNSLLVPFVRHVFRMECRKASYAHREGGIYLDPRECAEMSYTERSALSAF